MIKPAYTLLAIFFLFSCANEDKEKTSSESKGSDTAIVNTPPPNPYAVIDISPMDMSYFPVDYSKRKMAHELTTPPVMRVIYSRPHKQGRVIFGNLLKYGEPWRLGANEATEIEFFQSVTIQNKKINPGRYVIYCIPYENKWTVILNNDIYTWGLKIDASKDLVRFDIPIKKVSANFEYFTMVFQPISNGAELVMAWDDTEARLPINF
ncbi:MAG TPA: DUF2911 domain-containing protein [Chitinophagaceae bacterium]|jgi:hypothetical protein|nr:DUF2911 domain-containing protein [Chitinophagaceae bacterium]